MDGCIRTLMDQTEQCSEILLVDNGSTDDSVIAIREKYPRVKVTECNRNLGFAEGNNVGCRTAIGDYFVLVNTDARLEKDCLEKLLDTFITRPDLAASQCKILRQDHESTVDSIGSLLTPTGFLYHMGYGRRDSPMYRSSYVFSTKGVCMMMPREVFNKLGGFDRDFFAYFEESDLCWRAWISGYKVMFVPSSVAYHIGGATSGMFPRSFIDFHSFKNRICSMIKNCEMKTLMSMLPLHIVLCLAVMVGFLIRGQRPRTVGIFKALVWNARNLTRTIQKRRLIQSELRRIGDNEVFAFCMAWPGITYFRQLIAGYVG